MSAENVDRWCRDCKLGEVTPGSIMNLPFGMNIMVTPKIKRNCFNRLVNFRNSLLSKIEETIGHEIPIERDERIVTFIAKCVKLDSYSPKE